MTGLSVLKREGRRARWLGFVCSGECWAGPVSSIPDISDGFPPALGTSEASLYSPVLYSWAVSLVWTVLFSAVENSLVEAGGQLWCQALDLSPSSGICSSTLERYLFLFSFPCGQAWLVLN